MYIRIANLINHILSSIAYSLSNCLAALAVVHWMGCGGWGGDKLGQGRCLDAEIHEDRNKLGSVSRRRYEPVPVRLLLPLNKQTLDRNSLAAPIALRTQYRIVGR